MKAMLILPLLAALALPASAAVPRKKNINDYSHLWTKSIFTSKPPPLPPGEEVSAFADWTLGGVSEIDGGHMVLLFNTKKQGESMTIRPDFVVINRGDTLEHLKPGDPGTFSISKVEFGASSWKETVVTLSSGGKTGPVRFDEKQIMPKAAAPAPPQNRPGQQGAQPVPGQPPGVQAPGQQGQRPSGSQRQPRPRVVPQPQQGQQPQR